MGIAMTLEDSWGGDITTAAIAHLAHSTPEEFRFTATDFNSYVTVSTAEGAPRRERGSWRPAPRPASASAPGWTCWDPGSSTSPEHPTLYSIAVDPADDKVTRLAPSPRLPDGDPRVGPYRLIREIGHGGMGTVYLGVRDDDAFQKRVAIKVLKRGMDTEAIVRRFRHERQILAGLEHPNIAGLLDGGTTPDGLPYFAMEYVEGQPIVELLRRRDGWTPRRGCSSSGRSARRSSTPTRT